MNRRLWSFVVACLLFGASFVLVGCGSSAPTPHSEPTDKQKAKEKMPAGDVPGDPKRK